MMIFSNFIYKAKSYFQKKYFKQDIPDSANNDNWINMEYNFFDKHETPSFRDKKNNITTIPELIYTIFDIKPNQIKSIIEINSNNKTNTIESNSYDIPIYHNDNINSIYYIKINENNLNTDIKSRETIITIYLQSLLTNNNGSTYLTITLLYLPHELNNNSKKQKLKLNIAIENRTFLNAKSEYNYLKEIIEKHKENPEIPLTKKEWKLLLLIDEDYAAEFFRAKKALFNKEYIDAILHFNNVYEGLKNKWYKNGLTSKEMKLFTECSFFIGYSYNRLLLYDKAYQYLEMASRSNSETSRFKKEFIECLIATKNILSIIYIDDYLQELKKTPEGEHTHDSLNFFYFLLRKKAVILIEMDQFEDAEYILYRLLEKEPNDDDLLNELALLQKKKKIYCNNKKETIE